MMLLMRLSNLAARDVVDASCSNIAAQALAPSVHYILRRLLTPSVHYIRSRRVPTGYDAPVEYQGRSIAMRMMSMRLSNIAARDVVDAR